MGPALSEYLEKGTEYPPETIGDYEAVTSSVAYIGNNLPFPSDGRIDTVRLNAPVAGNVVFAVGDIDQFGIFLEESTFSKTAVVGDNTFSAINIVARKGQVMLVKSSLATLNLSAGGSYIKIAAAGDPVTVVTGRSIM